MSDTGLYERRTQSLSPRPFEYDNHPELRRRNGKLVLLYRDRNISRGERNAREEELIREYIDSVHDVLMREYPEYSDREWSLLTLAELRRIHALRAEEEATRIAELKRATREAGAWIAEKLRPLGELTERHRGWAVAAQVALGAAIAAGATYALVTSAPIVVTSAAVLGAARAAGITVAVRPGVRWILEKLHSRRGSAEDVAERNFEEFHVSQRGDEEDLPLREQMKLALLADAAEVERRRRERTLWASWLASAVVGGAASYGMHALGADAALRDALTRGSAPQGFGPRPDVAIPEADTLRPSLPPEEAAPPAFTESSVIGTLFGTQGVTETVESGDGMIATLADLQAKLGGQIAALSAAEQAEVPESVRLFLGTDPHLIADRMGAWIPGDGSLKIYPGDIVRLSADPSGALRLSWEPGGERLVEGAAAYGPGAEEIPISLDNGGLEYAREIPYDAETFTDPLPPVEYSAAVTEYAPTRVLSFGGSGGELGTVQAYIPNATEADLAGHALIITEDASGVHGVLVSEESVDPSWPRIEEGDAAALADTTTEYIGTTAAEGTRSVEHALWGRLSGAERVVVDGVHAYSAEEAIGRLDGSASPLSYGVHTLDVGDGDPLRVLVLERGVYSLEEIRVWNASLYGEDTRLLYGGEGETAALAAHLAIRDGVPYAYVTPDGVRLVTPDALSPSGVVEEALPYSSLEGIREPIPVNVRITG